MKKYLCWFMATMLDGEPEFDFVEIMAESKEDAEAKYRSSHPHPLHSIYEE
jgi:hypothetical protein